MKNLAELYESFREQFPPERLRVLTLDEYTNLNRDDSFCYWLEKVTYELGSIWGGSSYKFGIYRRNVTDKEVSRPGYRTDGTYAWLRKYGNTAGEAFESVRQNLIRIQQAAETGQFEEVDAVDFGEMCKWKIAYLYANRQLIGIFSPEIIREIAGHKGLGEASQRPVSEVQRYLMSLKGDRDLFAYSQELWEFSQTLKRTWLYSPGQNAYLWDELYRSGEMAIGWGAVGDLRQYKNKGELKECFVAEYRGDPEANPQNNIKDLYDFCHTITPGDTVIVRRGLSRLLGYGYVTSDYEYDEQQEDFVHRRRVNWIKRGDWEYPVNQRKTLVKLNDPAYAKTILAMFHQPETTITTALELLKEKKQLLLEGAPGTGKTYATSEIAVRLCSPDFIPENRGQLMEEYIRLKNEGRILFTTFHQSLDYEEFVEGLKPVRDGGTLRYEPQGGLFKRICEQALLDAMQLSKESEAELEFDDLYDDLLEEFRAGRLATLQLKAGGSIELLRVTEHDNLYFRHAGSTKKYDISRERLRKLYREYDTPEKVRGIKNIDSEFRAVIGGCNSSGYWAALNHIASRKTKEEIADIDPKNLTGEERERLIRNLLAEPRKQTLLKPAAERPAYVLIVDEINRGNISKILGELITLLEADKRIGEPNGLTATLPYSRAEFGVPDNLYVIGTMNTADRSVGGIDYAIRRRFAFLPLISDRRKIEEYYPAEQLPEELKQEALGYYDEVRGLMEQACTIGFDDLMVGHSYFMARTSGQLKRKMRYEVRPLLLEYLNDGLLAVSRNSDEYNRIRSFGE